MVMAGTMLFMGSAQAQEANGGLPTREEIERGVLEGALPDQGRPLAVDDEIERSPCSLAGPEFSDIRFTLTSVNFTGTEAVPDIDLSSSYAGFVGQDLPVGAICEIRDRAASMLRGRGYLAAVQVPPQEIDGGVITLDVLLAKMTQVQVRGDAGPLEGALERYIEKLTGQAVFNALEAERYLLLASDIPGLEVRLALRPTGDTPGEVIGEFSVLRTPLQVDAVVQNLGTPAVGRWGGQLRAQFNGLTGLGDRTSLGVYTTADFDEQQVVQLSHDFRVGGEGLTFSGDFVYAWAEPDVGAAIHSETLVAGIRASYPLVRSQANNLFVSGGFQYVDQDVRFGDTPLTADTLSVAFARLDVGAIDPGSILGRGGFSASEPRWSARGSVEIRHGLDIFGASQGCGPALMRCAMPGYVSPSRVEGDPTAFVLRYEAELVARLTPEFAISVAPRMQYSPDPLFSYEEFSAGNYTVGRGYDPGTIIGDSGYGTRTELRYGSLIPPGPGQSAFQPYVFMDSAWVWNKDRSFDGLDPQKLVSLGGGVRANVMNGATVDAALAVPLKRAGFQTEKGDVRFLLTLTAQLQPWNFRN